VRVRDPIGRLACAVALALSCGCARIAPYQGATEGVATPPAVARPDASGRPGLRRGADADPHDLGVLESPGDADSIVVLVYGDNRPGLRTQTRSRVYRLLRYHGYTGVARVALGVLCAPFFVLESLVPTLDGPRDFVTLFTHRPRSGGERQVLEAMLGDGPPQLVISTGDVVQDGHRGRQWADFVSHHAGIRSRAPYLVAPGNHEHIESAIARASWNAALGAPPRPDRYWQSVDLPDSLARFVFVDANVLANVKGIYPDSVAEALSREQLAWVDQVLTPNFRYRFIVLHHPLVSAGHHTTDWDPPAAAARRERLLRICRSRNVTAILAGHEHLYQRVFLRDANGGGLWHITTGGAGSPLHGVSAARRRAVSSTRLIDGLSIDPESIRWRTAYHYCRLVLPRATGQAPVLAVMEVRRGRSRLMDRIVLDPHGVAR
jgi:calcineurin-like phosphoesterase family protein